MAWCFLEERIGTSGGMRNIKYHTHALQVTVIFALPCPLLPSSITQAAAPWLHMFVISRYILNNKMNSTVRNKNTIIKYK